MMRWRDTNECDVLPISSSLRRDECVTASAAVSVCHFLRNCCRPPPPIVSKRAHAIQMRLLIARGCKDCVFVFVRFLLVGVTAVNLPVASRRVCMR